jgi:hypothetical protein
MKLMRVASMALAAYLVNSALLHVHDAGALVVAVEGQVELAHQGQGALAFGRGGVHAEHDAVGAHEVVHRGALFEEFGVGDDGEPGVLRDATRAQLGLDGGAHLVSGAHGHGGFVHHDLEAGHVAADVARGGQHVLQVGAAIFIGRGAHGNELDVAKGHGVGHVGGEAQAPGLDVGLDQRAQAGLVDGHAAAVQGGDLGGVDVQAADAVAQVRQAGAGDEADVAGADDGDVHFGVCSSAVTMARTTSGMSSLAFQPSTVSARAGLARLTRRSVGRISVGSLMT